ncbi:YitT family protein [Cohnella kolymensis]|uniref:YitT family protein n=1 Tax=Cohnella kolymensis TaxID=1590652 RepID=UPI00137925AD|nr:YitT family protein [Cohnella kolymensis]
MKIKSLRLLEIFVIVCGTAITALTYYLFLQPNEIMAPGLGGVVILIGHFLPISLGIIYFVLNIPLFGIGFYYVGSRFILYSFLGMASLSFFLWLFAQVPGIHQPLVGCLLGGLISGAAISFVLFVGGSTGGMDIVCVIVNRRWPQFTLGKVMFVMNAAVVLFTGFIFGVEKLVLTTLSIYLAGKSLDLCYGYLQNKKQPKEIYG